MNRPTLDRSAPCLADLSLNWVIRLASPKPVMQPSTQASWACSGTCDWTNSVHRSGSSPTASSWAAPTPGAAAQHVRVVPGGDRVQVDHAVEGVVGVLHGDPVAHRAEVVAQVEGVGGGLDPGQHPWTAMRHGRHSRRCNLAASAAVGHHEVRGRRTGASTAARRNRVPDELEAREAVRQAYPAYYRRLVAALYG